MATTFSDSKADLMRRAGDRLAADVVDSQLTTRQKVALTCRVLFDAGHDSGLAGQITARAETPGTYYTQRLGLGFDEITEDNLLVIDEDLNVLESGGMANPANRFTVGYTGPDPMSNASCTPMPSTVRRCRCWRCR